VQLAKLPDCGVPRIGVTNVGDVLSTLFPVPVAVVTPEPPLTTATIPVTFSDVPPTLKPAAAPVMPVPGPEN
jgi:hypothetical protein